MSMNLTASFPAYIAAGLKVVPKQLMYCIPQDATLSSTLYKLEPELDHKLRNLHQPDVIYDNDNSEPQPNNSPSSTTNNDTFSPKSLETVCSRIATPTSQTVKVFPDSSTNIEIGTAYQSQFKNGNKTSNFVTLHSLSGNQTYSDNISSTLPDIVQQQIKGSLVNERLFKCLTCGKSFRQKATLIQHERIHTDSRPFNCSECGKHFRQQSHLTQHVRIHANEKPFSCVFCNKSFRQRAILNQHLRIHSGEKPFMCVCCGKHFRQKAILNQHVRIHKDVNQSSATRRAAPANIWPVSNLNDVDSTTNTMSKPDMSIRKIDHTVTNIKIECNGDDSPSSSTGHNYPKANGSFLLVKREQGNPLNPTSVSVTNNHSLSLFVRCPICQKEFKQRSTLLQHGCIHIESRPYHCSECGKRFRQQSHLTQHLRIHANEKPYSCPYCGRQFRQRTILNQHIRIHTGEKPYRCEQCAKEFRQKAILDQHIRTHQGERPFSCPMPACKRRFINEAQVKKHIDHHMSPSTRNRKSNNTNTLNQAQVQVQLQNNLTTAVTSCATPAAFFKPDVYFSQCYGQQFLNHSYTTPSFSNLQNTTTVQIISNIADISKLNIDAATTVNNMAATTVLNIPNSS